MSHNLDARNRQAMAELGLSLATDADIAEAHAIAAPLLGPNVASVQTLQQIQARTGCTCFIGRGADGRLVAAISTIPLSPAAAETLQAGAFDGLAPAEHLAALPGQPVIAWYGWGMAGLTLRGQAMVVKAAMRQQQDIYAAVPFYARAATSNGERVMQERMGAHPHPGPDGLVYAPPWAPSRKVA